ncbi:MAG: S1C family serine protease [Bacteroidia bacterium]
MMTTEEYFERAELGLLSTEELEAFTIRLQTDPLFNKDWQAFLEFKSTLAYMQRKQKFKKQYAQENTIHSKTNRHPFKIQLAAAAVIIVISIFSTILILRFSGLFLHSNSREITYLNRKVDYIDQHQRAAKSTEALKKRKELSAHASNEGSAFAINNQGLLLTSYHLIQGFNEMFISNDAFERIPVKLEFANPELDIAVLKIQDSLVYQNWKIPYNFRYSDCRLGEDVFTLGYPRKDVVYGTGVLSSRTGFDEDSTMCQISIPVNPGNSGGPVFDKNGQVIGMIKGKNMSAEGESFALKAPAIKSVIEGHKIQNGIANTVNKLKGCNRDLQLKRINPYVFNVVVFKH